MDRKTKFLYVDDESINTKLIEINFSERYEILIANSGNKGLEVLNANPDTSVVLSDMKMPLMNGLEFIRQAKCRFPDKRYYILSGFDITDEIQDALDTGLIEKYFRKPFNRREIESAIDNES